MKQPARQRTPKALAAPPARAHKGRGSTPAPRPAPASTQPSPPDSCPPFSTRDRLLEAAGEVFAEYGLKDATVRDICTRAGANIASINYHFQGKDALYLCVIDYAQQQVRHARPITIDPAAAPQERLHQFIRAFIARVLDPSGPAWHAKLMLREMVEPSPALDRVVESTIRPTFAALATIVADLVPGLSPDQTRLACSSIIGQCLLHRHCEPVLCRLFPNATCSAAELERLSDHITHFSLAGLTAMHAAPAPPRRRKPQ